MMQERIYKLLSSGNSELCQLGHTLLSGLCKEEIIDFFSYYGSKSDDVREMRAQLDWNHKINTVNYRATFIIRVVKSLADQRALRQPLLSNFGWCIIYQYNQCSLLMDENHPLYKEIRAKQEDKINSITSKATQNEEVSKK